MVVERKETPRTLLVGMQIGTATMENSMDVPQIVRIELLYEPAIPLLGIYLKILKSFIHKDTCTSMTIVALLVAAKRQKQPACP